jgi:membrane fusion protein (multidrug efflux system)
MTLGEQANEHKRNRWLLGITALLLLIGIGVLLYWLIIGRFYVVTQDAYVHGNQVMLTPQVAGGVRAIYADETDFVMQGQLVVTLDCLDLQLVFEERKARLAEVVREVKELFENVTAKTAAVAVQEAELRQAKLDLMHREPLVLSGAVSIEEFEQYRTNVDVLVSQVRFATQELIMAAQRVVNTTPATHPRVLEAITNFREAYLDCIRCQVLSPVTGYIAKRTVQVGDRVNLGDTLLIIVPLDELWLEANYRETQLKNVRIGQPVEFTADLYGRRHKFTGNVTGFQAGTGSAFALLPPENGSGNWIKIVQRLPIRVNISKEQLRDYPLFIGLSLRVSIDTHDREGHIVSTVPVQGPVYSTPIYFYQTEQLETLEKEIGKIIDENSVTPL